MKFQYEKEYDSVFDELKDRGYFDASTDEAELAEKLKNEKLTFYCGFDATADSLTVGPYPNYGYDENAKLWTQTNCSFGWRNNNDW